MPSEGATTVSASVFVMMATVSMLTIAALIPDRAMFLFVVPNYYCIACVEAFR